MPAPAGSFTLIDLEHGGRRESVAAYLVETSEGPVLVDPGPTATLPRLRAGLLERGYQDSDLTALLLTHIHLDHAGASGTLARANPRLRVWVHERGAPHLVDPSKLISSATRLYGDRMEGLWGEIAPVPAEQVGALAGGEELKFGDRELKVAYTPGHAWHHLSYFEPETEVAFVGDTAGIYGPRLPVVLPVTPPPDFDLEAWLDSIGRILTWQPSQIALTHFGTSPNPAEHLESLRQALIDWAAYARETLELPGSDEGRIRIFGEKLRSWTDGKVPEEQADRFLAGAGPEACWQGLARYWRRRG